MKPLISRPLYARRICTILAGFASLLFIIHTLFALFIPDFNAGAKEGFMALFNLNAEVSIPTWFSQTILFIAASVALLIALTAQKYTRYWMGISAIFLYMSIDEGAAIHELTTGPMQQLLGVSSGHLYYAWIVLFGSIALVIGLLYLRFLRDLPTKTRWLLVLSGVIFVSGAIGVEMFEASIAAQTGETSLTYTLLVGIEEFMEMVGVTIAIYALTSHYNSLLELKPRRHRKNN